MSPSWAPGCPELRRGPVRLQASDSVQGSLLSGEVWRGLVWLQASESVLCSRLTREARGLLLLVGVGQVECDVVPHLVEDPIVVLAVFC